MEFEKKRKQKQKTTPYYESLPISAKALCDRVLKLEDIKPNVLVQKKWNSTKKKKKTKTKTRPLPGIGSLISGNTHDYTTMTFI
jgi:hypothetical protein